MATYKIIRDFQGLDACILRDGKDSIPFDPANIDYQEYLAWVAEGNEPEPAPQPGQDETNTNV